MKKAWSVAYLAKVVISVARKIGKPEVLDAYITILEKQWIVLADINRNIL